MELTSLQELLESALVLLLQAWVAKLRALESMVQAWAPMEPVLLQEPL